MFFVICALNTSGSCGPTTFCENKVFSGYDGSALLLQNTQGYNVKSAEKVFCQITFVNGRFLLQNFSDIGISSNQFE